LQETDGSWQNELFKSKQSGIPPFLMLNQLTCQKGKKSARDIATGVVLPVALCNAGDKAK